MAKFIFYNLICWIGREFLCLCCYLFFIVPNLSPWFRQQCSCELSMCLLLYKYIENINNCSIMNIQRERTRKKHQTNIIWYKNRLALQVRANDETRNYIPFKHKVCMSIFLYFSIQTNLNIYIHGSCDFEKW